ncbi:MAG: alpha-L-fucosidase [Phycisphaerales bacterium]
MRTPIASASVVALIASVLAASGAVHAPPAVPPKDERLGWWRDARFGMFIHFGLYSVPAGTWDGKPVGGIGEWLLQNAKVDPIVYERTLVPQFNPSRFDAREWARIAKDAGMGYVVITTKHHDGFALWDSAASDYDVMATPFRRDIMRELADAVRADGMRMCWYHSIMDWHHPDYQPRREWDRRPVDPASFPRYVEHMNAQLRELLTKYGDIGILWFDGEWEGTWNHDWGKKTDDFVRSLQPRIIVNNRVDSGRAGMEGFSADEHARGDYGTPEQTIPPNGMPGKDWETCMTMNDTWGYKSSDQNWKSAQTMIRMLCDIASKGGNFLLNVGPKGDGTIPQESVERLARMGEWMRVNGESIRGTQASPFTKKLPWGRATMRSRRGEWRDVTLLYLHVFDWPADGTLRLEGIANAAGGAQVLGANDRTPAVKQDAGAIVVSGLGTTPADPDCTVVRIDLKGEPEVTPFTVTPAADGSLACMAADAVVTGSIQYEDRFANLGWWRDMASEARWPLSMPAAGTFDATVDYAASAECGGTAEWIVRSAGTEVARGTAELPGRAGWGEFAALPLGRIALPAGPCEFVVKAKRKAGDSFINLRRIDLRPAK